jgi:hypothetical protein
LLNPLREKSLLKTRGGSARQAYAIQRWGFRGMTIQGVLLAI